MSTEQQQGAFPAWHTQIEDVSPSLDVGTVQERICVSYLVLEGKGLLHREWAYR